MVHAVTGCSIASKTSYYYYWYYYYYYYYYCWYYCCCYYYYYYYYYCGFAMLSCRRVCPADGFRKVCV